MYPEVLAALKKGQLQQAMAFCEKTLAKYPNDPTAYAGIGRVFVAAGDWRSAFDPLKTAYALGEVDPTNLVLLAQAAGETRQFDLAALALTRALEQDATHRVARILRGISFKELKRYEEAFADFDTVLQVEPENLAALDQWVSVSRILFLQDPAREQRLLEVSRAAARKRAPAPPAISGPMIRLLSTTDASNAELATWIAGHAKPRVSPIWPHRKRPNPRLRVGYLHADANRHPTGLNLHHFFELHDRSQFEVFVYSFGADDGSVYRQSVREGAEHFVDLQGQTDDAIATRIARDQIDVLVDLMGVMARNKLGVLWRRPASVQVTYFADPGALSFPGIDFVIADAMVVPPESEHTFGPVLRLPRCYFPAIGQAMTPRPEPTPRAELGLPEDAFVFASFNHISKVSLEVAQVWARILRRSPGSVLWALAAGNGTFDRFKAQMVSQGVLPYQVIEAPFEPEYTRHLARIGAIDLMLDTWPWGAHTTSADCLRAARPVLTLRGDCFASRVGASMCQAVGLDALVTSSANEYEDRAVSLAETGTADLKAHLHDSTRLALFSTQDHMRALEAVYHEAYARRPTDRSR